MPTIDDLLQRAIHETVYVKSKDEFIVKDLFSKKLWDLLPIGTRMKLGDEFKKYVKEFGGFSLVDKTEDDQQIYRKN